MRVHRPKKRLKFRPLLIVSLMLFALISGGSLQAQVLPKKKKNVDKSVQKPKKNKKSPQYPPDKGEQTPYRYTSTEGQKPSKKRMKNVVLPPGPGIGRKKVIMRKGGAHPYLNQQADASGSNKSFRGYSKRRQRRMQRKLAKRRLKHGTYQVAERFKANPNIAKYSPNKLRLEGRKSKKLRYKNADARNQRAGLVLGRKKSSEAIAIEAITRANAHNSKTRGVNLTARTASYYWAAVHMKNVGATKGRRVSPGPPNMNTPRGSAVTRIYTPKQRRRQYRKQAPNPKDFSGSFILLPLSRQHRMNSKLARSRMMGGVAIKQKSLNKRDRDNKKIAKRNNDPYYFPGSFMIMPVWQQKRINRKIARDKEMGAWMSKKNGDLRTSRVAQWWDVLWGKADKQKTKVVRRKSHYDSKEREIWYD
ncbi:hypothetical protein FUAX_34000 [Fulvitalea axinellae]|uniref:Uncharacterized protein n=1 Tax=Fulvitalea axinellae TaxID=1182444 RepID=A0AAU9CS76_9BACT|nr:hypothetical protein FUAX_34000 [Fulvitalea axinellae]